MATKTYVAGEVRQVEVQKGTVTAVAAAGVVKLTVNGKVVSYVCTAADTVDTAAAALVANIRAAVDGEFKEFAVAIDGTVTSQINVTGNDAGTFVSIDGNTALSFAGTGGATMTSAVVTRGLSPEDASDVLNWSGSALPANAGDDWVFEDAKFPARYMLSALSAKAATSITVYDRFEGNGVGLQKFSVTGGYLEFRGGRLAVTGCPLLTVNLPAGAAREAYRFDVGSGTACALAITGDGNGQVGQEAVDWIGTNAGNTAEVDGGSLKVASYVGEVATLSTLALNNAACTLGSGVTMGTIQNESSQLDLSCAVTTFGQNGDGAATVVRGTGTITTMTIDGGSVFHNGTGTITTLNVGPGATIDFSGSKLPITITNKVNLYEGATFWDPYGRVTLTAGYQTVRTDQSKCTINNGTNRNYAVS